MTVTCDQEGVSEGQRQEAATVNCHCWVGKPGQGKSNYPEAGEFFLISAHIPLQSRGLGGVVEIWWSRVSVAPLLPPPRGCRGNCMVSPPPPTPGSASSWPRTPWSVSFGHVGYRGPELKSGVLFFRCRGHLQVHPQINQIKDCGLGRHCF